MCVWWATEIECVSAVARLERDDALTAAATTAALHRMELLAASWNEVQPVASCAGRRASPAPRPPAARGRGVAARSRHHCRRSGAGDAGAGHARRTPCNGRAPGGLSGPRRRRAAVSPAGLSGRRPARTNRRTTATRAAGWLRVQANNCAAGAAAARAGVGARQLGLSSAETRKCSSRSPKAPIRR